jgi:hypothetical protein
LRKTGIRECGFRSRETPLKATAVRPHALPLVLYLPTA